MKTKKVGMSAILDVEKIRRGEFIKQIPEFYELKDIIENNDWHDNDSVFNHTLTVLGKLEKILKDVKGEILDYLDRKVSGYTRRELLSLAVLLHDVAKKETIIKKNAKTSCPNHEEKSAIKANRILSRFDLSEKEKELIIRLIKHHDTIHLILKMDTAKRDREFDKFKKEHSGLFWEVALLGMADTLGCQPKGRAADEVNCRLKFYRKLLFNS
jgi:hypothetical protein